MIRLERTLTVQSFDLEATIATGRERPEFLAVARLAADIGRPLHGKDVSTELLGNLPDHVGWRVIDRCVALGLLERQGHQGPAALTNSGVVALEHGQVLVPEEAAWRVFLADDPLIDSPLLHVCRLDTPSARDTRAALPYGRKGEPRPRPSSGAAPPPALLQAAQQGRTHVSVAAERTFQVRELAQRGEPGPSGQLQLIVEWAENAKPIVRLVGRLPAASSGSAPEVDRLLGQPSALAGATYDDAWTSIVATDCPVSINEIRDWLARVRQRLLPRAFDGSLTEAARRSLRTELDVPPLNLGTLGRFDATRLENVALVPRSDGDAQAWAEWLQQDAIGDYVTPEQLRLMATEVARRFPHHQPRLAAPEALLRQAQQNPTAPRAHYLLAPADLGLWRAP
jgi:hypothetical protein